MTSSRRSSGDKGPLAAIGEPQGAGIGPAQGPQDDSGEGVSHVRRATNPDAARTFRRLAEAIRSGRVTRDQAVEQLVQRALSSPEVAGLSPDLRAELEGQLRRALEDDPALSGLAQGLGQVR